MNRAWGTVLLAAGFEVGWVLGLGHADSWWTWGATVAAIAASFGLMIAAVRAIPAGTAYAVFAGCGTAGTALAEIVWLGAHADPVKLGLIALLAAGVVGLKWLSGSPQKEGEAR
ncbi:multidrug efflux SMR transporter [Paenibacillus sp. IB182496]|uniref:Multidrug efflux SMR transporter n=1 Tax=Paenibacillus sabuli TaxID=2772509 RepID=A0A927BNP5_9BACL|nr:SMR family transporter [Paenibacillus sabuli]MBD2843898.1 multidrug efflux SMR transporter [Paenibacillus sabuli]